MAAIRKAWYWDSDEGFTWSGGLGGMYYAGDGAPPGCQLIQFGGGNLGEVKSPLSTWSGWGLPAGETVSFVELTGLHVRQDNSSISPATLSIGLLGGSPWTITGITDEWQQLGPQGVCNISQGYQAETSPAQLYIGTYPSPTRVANVYVDNLVITINGQGTGPGTGSVRRLVSAVLGNLVAAAAVSSTVSGGKRGLSIWLNVAGQARGSAWHSYNLLDVDDGTPIGLVFEPSGRLVLSYVRAGNAYTRTNDRFGERTAWSGESALTGSAMVTNSGFGARQTWKVRAE